MSLLLEEVDRKPAADAAEEVKERLANIGVETGGNSPAQFAAMIKSEMVRMGKVIKDAGIRVE